MRRRARSRVAWQRIDRRCPARAPRWDNVPKYRSRVEETFPSRIERSRATCIGAAHDDFQQADPARRFERCITVSQCLTCQFYDRKSVRAADARGLQWGLCRREAPHLNPSNPKSHAIEGVWPTVRDDDWCGQWQAQRKVESGATTAAMLVQGGATPVTSAPPPARAHSAAAAGPRTLPMHGGAAAIAAGYKPTAHKNKP